MAVVTVKSTPISNRDAVPPVITNSRVAGAPLHHARGVVAIANGDSVGSKFIALRVPTNAVPVSLRITSPDIGTTTIADIGVYRSTYNGGAVVDADFFASALSLKDGALSKSEVLFESGTLTVANSEKPLWELLGATSDPTGTYDIALTLTGAADAAGSVLVEMDYTF